MSTQLEDQAAYQDLRPLMFSIAYRMTGSVGDAEDIVQEALLGLTKGLSEGTVVESPKAYLAAATTRHANQPPALGASAARGLRRCLAA